MAELRKQLDLQDVPFILGGLGDFLKDCPLDDNLKNYVHINDALQSIANSAPMTGYASAEGLTSNPDFLHFSADGLHHFGLRYFEAFEQLNQGRTLTQDAPSDTQRTQMELL